MHAYVWNISVSGSENLPERTWCTHNDKYIISDVRLLCKLMCIMSMQMDLHLALTATKLPFEYTIDSTLFLINIYIYLFNLDFTPSCAVLCVILLGIMEKFPSPRSSMLPSRIYQPDTSKDNFKMRWLINHFRLKYLTKLYMDFLIFWTNASRTDVLLWVPAGSAS